MIWKRNSVRIRAVGFVGRFAGLGVSQDRFEEAMRSKR